MIAVLETSPGVFALATGMITRLDGEFRDHLEVILHESWTAAERAAYGVFLAAPADPVPAGKRIISSNFQRLADGTVKQVHVLEDLSLAAAKGAKVEAVKARAGATFANGYRPTTGPLAGHVLQVDTASQIRLDQSLSLYKRQIETGKGAELGARFRTLANVNVSVSYADGYAAIVDGMGGWGKRVIHKTWDLVDQIVAPTIDTKAKLDAIDINTGWPSE